MLAVIEGLGTRLILLKEWLGIVHTQATFKGQNCSLGMRLGLQ